MSEVVEAWILYEMSKVFREIYKYLDEHSYECSQNLGAFGYALRMMTLSKEGVLNYTLSHFSVLLYWLAYYGFWLSLYFVAYLKGPGNKL